MSQLRGLIVDHMMTMTDKLICCWGAPSIRRGGHTVDYNSLEEYYAGEKPKEVGTFATHYEIQAASSLLQTPIFTCSQKDWDLSDWHWIRIYDSVQNITDTSAEMGLYLNHPLLHFEPVFKLNDRLRN